MNPDIQKAFHEAVSNNDVETARRMIAAGADVNAPYDEHDYSILTACRNGNYELVRLLIESGADVNVRDKMPITRTISFEFNAQNRVSRINCYHSNYSEYEYGSRER